MLIRRNVDPKVLMELLLTASRTYRKMAPAIRPRAPDEAGCIGKRPDDRSGHRPHHGGEGRHVRNSHRLRQKAVSGTGGRNRRSHGSEGRHV